MNKKQFHIIHNRTLSPFVGISEFAKYSDNSSRMKTVSTESAAVGTGAMAAMTMAMSALGNQQVRQVFYLLLLPLKL